MSTDRPAPLTREQLKNQERENILAALERTGGRVFGPEGAAALLGMKPSTLATRMRTLGVKQVKQVVPE